ncbi:uncharacterized protein LOC133526206 isoform X1 [Cydia pomonella]|uniref:uncharacterized protein LOC133526206 isoform X1 n=1 Tax=Cydia pomonella TaxID=82600 RepID=UPI002ADD512D|nr:uncharacterized protein LOC133526206 isoform X1 [Cydia pomonella]
MFRFLLVVALICSQYVSVGPLPARRRSRPPTSQKYSIFPIFGRVTPSPEIVEFVDYVFGKRRSNAWYASTDDKEQYNNDKAARTDSNNTATDVDSGEDLRPSGLNIQANLGFEQYWHGGDWVYRKAELDHCNTSDSCGHMNDKYGRVCAGNHDLTAHHTFDTVCDMYDANCRDGTVTVFTSMPELKNSSIKWYPVTTSGYMRMKVVTSMPVWFVLARTRNLHSKFKRLFYYAYSCWQYFTCVRLYKDDFILPNPVPDHDTTGMVYNAYQDSIHAESPKDPQFLHKRTIVSYILTWNETTGFIKFGVIHNDMTENYIRDFKHTSADHAFPMRYIGLVGGNVTHPTWWELTGPGIPRGYLMAYRGKCREDIPPLPTEPAPKLRHELDIDMYNFAERMDEFGYNYSRVPNHTVQYFDEDYDITITPRSNTEK